MAVGQTIHVNHDTCPAGADTRRRLYITRKMTDSGGITDLAYCHNCGAGWADSSAITNIRAMTPGTATPPGELDLDELHLVPAGTEGFPQEARDFLAPITINSAHPTGGGEWDEEDVRSAGIGFNRANGRLVLPIYDALNGCLGEPDSDGARVLLGWQERRLYGNGPKYITTDNGAPLDTTVHLWNDPAEVIVFTEDYLSAIRVSQACREALAVPLLRYKVRAERVAELAKSRLPAIIWLDNDRPEVKNESAHLERLWRALGNKATGTHSTLEPKKCMHGVKWIEDYIERCRKDCT